MSRHSVGGGCVGNCDLAAESVRSGDPIGPRVTMRDVLMLVVVVFVLWVFYQFDFEIEVMARLMAKRFDLEADRW